MDAFIVLYDDPESKRKLCWYDHRLTVRDNCTGQLYGVSLLQVALLLMMNDGPIDDPAVVCPANPEAAHASMAILAAHGLCHQNKAKSQNKAQSHIIDLDHQPLLNTTAPSCVPRKVEVDRQMILQSAIARTLKLKRSCPAAELARAVAETAEQWFVPTSAEIEREVITLVERGYAERVLDDERGECIVYVP
jgi:hypothetical protein